MFNRHLWHLPLITLASVFLLAILWEFALEPYLLPLFNERFSHESSADRWEYVFTSLAFAALALAVPTWLLFRSEARRRQAQDSLEKSESRYRLLYEANPCMMITVDSSGKIQSINEFGAQQLGFRPDALVGRLVVELAPKGHGADFDPCLGQSLEALASPCYFEAPLQRADGSVFWARHAVRLIHDVNGQPTLMIASQDITAERQRSERLSHEASHDALTGLLNRREFDRRLARAVDSAAKGQTEHALAYLDLDDFKAINDSFGHMAGDRILRRLATVLRSRVRSRDTVARVGGDEFAVLMEHCTIHQAKRVARDLLAALERCPFHYGGHPLRVKGSIGLAAISAHSGDPPTVLNAADTACYAAKQQGGNRLHLHGEDGDTPAAAQT